MNILEGYKRRIKEIFMTFELGIGFRFVKIPPKLLE